jgi:hypothetical protein
LFSRPFAIAFFCRARRRFTKGKTLNIGQSDPRKPGLLKTRKHLHDNTHTHTAGVQQVIWSRKKRSKQTCANGSITAAAGGASAIGDEMA